MKTQHNQLKILFALAMLAALVSSCRKDIEIPDTDFEKLFGEWQWIDGSGGFSGSTTGGNDSTVTVAYSRDGIYKKFHDGKKKTRLHFSFVKGETIFSTEQKYGIAYSKGKSSKLGIISHSFRFQGSDTLILNDECFDCWTYIYVRVK